MEEEKQERAESFVLDKEIVKNDEENKEDNEAQNNDEELKEKELAQLKSKEHSPSKHKRLASLDAVRGLTIAVMILVDNAGWAYPSIGHVPWNGLHLADFVMPWFLFIVGASMAFSFKRIPNKKEALKKAAIRALKLFFIGLALQGGGFPSHYKYGFNIRKLRITGILQRIALGYFLTAIIKIYAPLYTPKPNNSALPNEDSNPSSLLLNPSKLSSENPQSLSNNANIFTTLSFYKKYSYHLLLSISILFLYTILTFLIYVPSWEVASTGATITCNKLGSLSPPCTVAGMMDRAILRQSHMYKWGYSELEECTRESVEDREAWCAAPFEPEGILTSIACIVSVWIGLHYGHVLVHCQEKERQKIWGKMGKWEVVVHWGVISAVFMVLGVVIHVSGYSFNKQLWSLSYLFFTAGCCGVCLMLFYVLIDLYDFRIPFLPFIWMGMNAILIFVFAACNVADTIWKLVYYQAEQIGDQSDPIKYTIINAIQLHIFRYGDLAQPRHISVLFYVLWKIVWWFWISWFLFTIGYFWKI
jgi:heparan-alpha-glucosaminide N-acetyltransferase